MGERACRVCEQGFTAKSRRVYCSDECRAEAGRRRAAAWYAERRGDPALRQRVKDGTRRHYEKIKADPQALAAKLEATAAWRAANAERMTKQNREWRHANAERVRAKHHRRRARLLNAFVAEVDAVEIWERDAGICGICRTEIDPLLAWPHKMSKTLDHIIPLAKGGTHEPDNVQLAHAVCNARKNDRLLTDVPIETQ